MITRKIEDGYFSLDKASMIPLSKLVNDPPRPTNFARAYLERDPQNLLDAVQSILDRITYKLGWKFRLEAEAKSIYRLWFVNIHLDYEVMSLDTAPQPITHSQNRHVVHTMVNLTTGMTLNERSLVELLTRGDFIQYTAVNLIRRAELHEMDEWLKLDGSCVTEPHPELKMAKLPDFSDLKMQVETGKLGKEWFE